MRLLLFRHGPAGTRESFAKTGRPDEERPLTSKGRKKTARAAAGARRLLKELDLLATSPLVRAGQTARILAEAYGGPRPSRREELSPSGDRRAMLKWLSSLRTSGARWTLDKDTVALIGHEPSLGVLAGWLMTGEAKALFSLGKAGACLLEFNGLPRAGGARLAWLLRPGQLRKLED